MPAEHADVLRSVDEIVRALSPVLKPSSVIIGVGNVLVGDDGAGSIAAARLIECDLPWHVFDAQTVPESFIMKIVGAKPESVVMIDALAFGGAPGEIRLLPSRKITGQGPSTHGPAPVAFLDALQMMHPCLVRVLGIQPEHTDFGEELSDAVHAAVDRIVEAFRTLAPGRP